MIGFPPYRLDPRAGRLWRGNQPVALRPKAWDLLRYLVEHPGALVTKDELHAAVWGDTVATVQPEECAEEFPGSVRTSPRSSGHDAGDNGRRHGAQFNPDSTWQKI